MKISFSIKISFFILTLVFMASGLVAISVGAYFWATPYARRRVVVTEDILIAGLAMGMAAIFSSFVGFHGFRYPVRNKKSLVLYGWLVVLVLVTELALGAVIWFRSLSIRDSFSDKWRSWDPALRGLFQETDGCCGYYDNTDFPADSISCRYQNYGWPGCVDMIYIYSDNYLRNIYTVLFGFVVVDIFAFFGSVILIQASNNQERYVKVDAQTSKSFSSGNSVA
ncbi:hypothetical protein K7432_006609 [Basidiobolus ranarum]|uniref:Tetraspanin n=1 Tax=Basidiobolus ranarum TaxID=34480 RepID=A0ABR2WUN8_9FUNG